MKAIETEHGGVKFRSRLEARWAVFFDELGIEWLYEHEGYEFCGGRYLPDFLLPTLDVFVEIKPKSPTLRESRRCGWLAATTGKRVFLFPHAPGAWINNDPPPAIMFTQTSRNDEERYDEDDCYEFCSCPVCGKIGVEYSGLGNRICGNDCGAEEDRTSESMQIANAARRANGFRFWSPGVF